MFISRGQGDGPDQVTQGDTMNTTTARQQAGTKAAAMTARLTDEALAQAWMVTEAAPISTESAMVRGWMMDELQARLGDDLFDAWLMDEDTDGSTADPIAYLARRRIG
jgi:hypothetical protein